MAKKSFNDTGFTINQTATKKGRKSPNMKKLKNGKLKNQYGVTFTQDEKRHLENLVRSANRKRKRMLDTEWNLEKLTAGKPSGKKIGESIGAFGYESDMVLKWRSKSMQRFKSKKEYNKYIKSLEKVVARDYIDKRIEKYKKNYIKALNKVFDGRDYAKGRKELAKIVKGLTVKQFMLSIQADENNNIEYIYSPEEKRLKLERLKNALQPENA